MYKQVSTLNLTLFPTVFYVPVRLLRCSFIGPLCAYISVSISMHKVAAGLFRGSTAFNHDTVLFNNLCKSTSASAVAPGLRVGIL